MPRTNSPICSSARWLGLITRSTPSPSTLSSASVTSAATSISSSLIKSSPVISQSTQTRRSLVAIVRFPVPLVFRAGCAVQERTWAPT